MPNRVTDPSVILDRIAAGPIPHGTEVTTGGCWIYTGKMDKTGNYGETIMSNYVRKAPHVWSYILARGPVPDGMQIDHRCNVTRCINPDHLKTTTARENVLRSQCPPAQNARKTHCKRDHPLSGDNLIVNAKGQRNCRECKRITRRAG